MKKCKIICMMSPPHPSPTADPWGAQNKPVSLPPGLGEVVPTGGGRGLRRVSAELDMGIELTKQ